MKVDIVDKKAKEGFRTIEVSIGVNGPNPKDLWVMESDEYKIKVAKYLDSIDDMDDIMKGDPLMNALYGYGDKKEKEIEPQPIHKDLMGKIKVCEGIDQTIRHQEDKIKRNEQKIKAKEFGLKIGIAEDLTIALKDIMNQDLTVPDNFSFALNYLFKTFRLTEKYNTSKDNMDCYGILNDHGNENPVIEDDVPTYKSRHIKSTIHPSWFKCKDGQSVLLYIIMSYAYSIYKKKQKDIAIFQADMLWITTFQNKIISTKYHNPRNNDNADYKNSLEWKIIQNYMPIFDDSTSGKKFTTYAETVEEEYD